jgi:hypothetical protein
MFALAGSTGTESGQKGALQSGTIAVFNNNIIASAGDKLRLLPDSD